MNLRAWIVFFAGVFGILYSGEGTPIKLEMRPVGSNLVEFSFGPVVTNAPYGVYARSNGLGMMWSSIGPFFSFTSPTVTITQNLSGLKGFSTNNLNKWRFVVGVDGDNHGSGLSDMWVELVLREDPFGHADGYANPMGDGWVNIQKMQNGQDPYQYYKPPPLYVDVRNYVDGRTMIYWEMRGGPLPQYFVVYRVDHLMKMVLRTNTPPLWNSGRPFPAPLPRAGTNGINRARPNPDEMRREQMAMMEERQYAAYLEQHGLPPQPGVYPDREFVTNPPVAIAYVYSQQGLEHYQYADTNAPSASPFDHSSYAVEKFANPVFAARLSQTDKAKVLKTRLQVTAQAGTNSYDLTVFQPNPYTRYILLIKDSNDPVWRASGYFEAGPNKNPIRLTTDTKGMMTSPQRPLAMPPVKYLADVVKPEFIAGYGEDSDGDGLPDFYEVMVTGTAPDDPDTGNQGILDGYRELNYDGFSTLEKFRRRVNPFKPVTPPATVELKEPTAGEVQRALQQQQSDLTFEPVIEVRIAGTKEYEEMGENWIGLFQLTGMRDAYRVRGKFDVRISWRPATIKPQMMQSGYEGP